jgi:hypothetical protein
MTSWTLSFATAKAYVARFPRGSLAQNMFRSALWNCLMNAFGRAPQMPPPFEAATDMALRITRRDYPDFTPIGG